MAVHVVPRYIHPAPRDGLHALPPPHLELLQSAPKIRVLRDTFHRENAARAPVECPAPIGYITVGATR